MSYVIEGLAVEAFRPLFGQSDEALAAQGIVRVRAEAKPGFPCRITLEDAEPGETLLLLHYADHAVATPYRNAFAIYVREAAVATARTCDALPQVFEAARSRSGAMTKRACCAAPRWRSLATPMRAFASSSTGPRSPISTRTTPHMAVSPRASIAPSPPVCSYRPAAR